VEGDDTTILDVALLHNDSWASITHKRSAIWGNGFGLIFVPAANRSMACLEQVQGALAMFGMAAAPPELLRVAGVYVAQRKPRTRGYAALPPPPVASCGTCACTTSTRDVAVHTSRGRSVTLNSADPDDAPLIDDGWAYGTPQTEHDLEALVEAVVRSIVPLFAGASPLPGAFGYRASAPDGTYGAALNAFLSAVTASSDQLGSDVCVLDPIFTRTCINSSQCLPTVPSLPVDRAALKAAIRPLVQSSQCVAWRA
jgi:hypothetical protein